MRHGPYTVTFIWLFYAPTCKGVYVHEKALMSNLNQNTTNKAVVVKLDIQARPVVFKEKKVTQITTS